MIHRIRLLWFRFQAWRHRKDSLLYYINQIDREEAEK